MTILQGKEALPHSTEPAEDLDSYDEDFEPVEVPRKAVTSLQAILEAARQRLRDAAEEKELKRKLAKKGTGEQLARLHELVGKREWEPVAWVARHESCVCLNCGSTSRNFLGWFTASQHRTDPTARRLQVGRRGIGLPYREELVVLQPTEHCGACVGEWIKRRYAVVVWKAQA